MKLLLKGGTVVSSSGSCKADVLIENEKILSVDKEISDPDAEILDVSGKLLFPGFIDAHTHFDLVGAARTADDFYTGTKAAAAGGTTCVIDFSTADRGMTGRQALEEWHRKADGVSSCDYGFHMSYTEWNDDLSKEVDEMVKEGITSFKLYMAYDNLRVSDADLYKILKRIGEIGGIVGTHCENGDMVKELTADLISQGKTTPEYHPLSRPALVEAEAVFRYLTIAKLADVPVNIVHLSTKLGYDIAEEFRKNGAKVYLETCPQYLVMDDSVYKNGTLTGEKSTDGFEGAKFVISPPIRKKSDCDCLWNALKNNRLDCISTDHCSFNYKKDKELGRDNFSKIPNGAPGVEHRPVVIYTFGVKQGKITKEQMCAYLSTNPAKLYGMYGQKGDIKPGFDADIVVWDENAEWTVSKENQNQACDYTPLEGIKVSGIAEKVFLRGTLISEKGRIVKENHGKYIFRDKCMFYEKD
ncbi:MAG: dihydropyrimidinase [Clostridiales bacterium]|nr:dihydropyrimidinase [Clostridiales bacterium]